MSAGEERIRLRVIYEGDQVRTGVRDLDAMDQALKRTAKSAQETGDATGKATQRTGMGLLFLSQAIEDAQYGFRSVLNNIPLIVMAMGGSGGLAAAVSIAAVATSLMADRWKDLSDVFKGTPIDGIGKQAAEWMKGLQGIIDGVTGDSPDARQDKADQRARDERNAKERQARLAKALGIDKESLDQIGKATQEAIAREGGGQALMDQFMAGMTQNDGRLRGDTEQAKKLRDQVQQGLADAIAGALEGDEGSLASLNARLRAAGMGDVADRMMQTILPARDAALAAKAEKQARDFLGKAAEGINRAMGDFNLTAPGMTAQQRQQQAAGFQGAMAGAGVDAEVQKALAQYLQGPGARAKLRFIPTILEAFGEAGFSEREAYEGMLQIFALMDQGTPFVTALQTVINRAARGGLRAGLARMRMGVDDVDAEAGAAMMGFGPDRDPRRQSRFGRRRRNDKDPLAGAAGGGAAGAAGDAGAAAGAAAGGFVPRGRQDERTPEEKAAAQAEYEQVLKYEAARAQARQSEMAAGMSGTPEQQAAAMMAELAANQKRQALINQQIIRDCDYAMSIIIEARDELERQRRTYQRMGR